MEMELISRESITPSTPTPPHLRIYPLSFIDHIFMRNYIPSLFFYHPNKVGQEYCDQDTKICELKKSLSQVLSRYYPFAGRFRDQLSIECNDLGVLFLVTRFTGTKLSTILQNPTETLLNPLFPDGLQWELISPCGSIVAIQISCFACGGMTISVCMCHKVGDANTLFNFVNDWATMNNREKEKGELFLPLSLLDSGVSMFPQGNVPIFPERSFQKFKTIVSKRFVFPASKIKSLREMVTTRRVQNPTRVQVVIALIHKCAIYALGLTLNTTLLHIAVNLRRRMTPRMPDKCVGNIVWSYFLFNPVVDTKEIEVHELVSKIKQGLCDLCDVFPNKFGGSNKDLSFISECLKQVVSFSESLKKDFSAPKPCDSEIIIFMYSSWCKLSMYETDFGWGKPIWATTSGTPIKNTLVLMDTKDGDGIEVVVNMDEKDMARFERHVELLQYASLNPNPEKC